MRTPLATAVITMALAVPPLAPFALPAADAAVPTCFGKTPNVVLTAGNDTWQAPDNTKTYVVYGGGGNDTIRGVDAYDYSTAPGITICGGLGNDYISGGVTNDKIDGGGGADHISDWSGSDLMVGGAGDDVIDDDSCEDCDRHGNDVLKGGGGNDVLGNGWGNDKVYGGGGADNLYDWECDPSYLDGGPGADYIESYRGSYEGETCDSYDANFNVIASPGDTVVGGTEYDRAVLSKADKPTGVESVTVQYPDH